MWDSAFFRARLNEWQTKGYIRKIIRGYYIFSDLKLNESVLFEIANKLYSPSYISFESALSRYGLIPEAVYGITSASARKTCRFRTPVGEFSYRTIMPRLFFGYDLVRSHEKCFKIASPEKAFLDYFYIHSDVEKKDDFASLRINRDLFLEKIQKNKLDRFVEKFAQEALAKRVNSFWEFVKHA